MSTYEYVFHDDRIDGTGISSMSGHVYIRMRSHATTPCGVLMLSSCVLFLFPQSRRNSRNRYHGPPRRELVTRVVPSRSWSSESGFADAYFPPERAPDTKMLFFQLGSARLCPNTSIFRVAYNIAQALLHRGLLSRDLDEKNTDYC